MSANASYRICPESGLLKEKDYRFGFGLDTSLYNRISAVRKEKGLKTRDDFKKDWDSRTGFAIDGSRLHTRHHPLHDLLLIEKSTGSRYIVDSVHKHHHFGFYLVLSIRKEGTQSHGQAIWINYSCKEPSIIEGLKEAHERFYSYDELLEIQKNKKFPHNIYFFESGIWNESHSSISRNMLSPSYHYFKKGDIYLRFNGKKIYCKEFNGENSRFYDDSFGMASETHYGTTININDFMKMLHENYYHTFVEITKKLIAKGFDIWIANPPKIDLNFRV